MMNLFRVQTNQSLRDLATKVKALEERVAALEYNTKITYTSLSNWRKGQPGPYDVSWAKAFDVADVVAKLAQGVIQYNRPVGGCLSRNDDPPA